MKYRPINPNPDLPARHTMYIACTGGGKSQCLKANPEIPKVGARVVGWDHAGDHPGLHYYSKAGFIRALKAGIKCGGGFRVFYAGDQDPDTFEWFIEVVWSILDGKVLTYVIVEELSAVCRSVGKAEENAAIFMNQSRKFGAIFHGTTQKPEEVAKTFYTCCTIKYIGIQNTEEMEKRMARQAGVTPQQLGDLDELQFYRSVGRRGQPEVITVPYRKNSGVIWKEEATT